MSGCLDPTQSFILYYITVPETIVLGLMVWGIIMWLITKKKIADSPLGAFIGGAKQTIANTAATPISTPNLPVPNEQYLPPPTE
jgi:hypothetical protein